MVDSRHQTRQWTEAARRDFLRRVRLFSELPPATIAAIAEHFRPRSFQRDTFIFHEGEPADTVHLLASGRVKIVRETEAGREVILRLIGPGEIFGGAGGWGESLYPASAVAQADAIVLQMPASVFTDLLKSRPDLALAIIRELGRRLREAEARIRDLQTERVERRIARILLRLARKTGVKTARGIDIGIRLSRQDLAELTGTTLSTASRILSGWSQLGIVIAGRERVTIVKPHALVTIAEELPTDEHHPA